MRKGKDRKKKENKSKFINASPRLHIFGSRVAEEKEKKKKEIKEKYVFWMLSHLNIFCCRLEVVKAKLKKKQAGETGAYWFNGKKRSGETGAYWFKDQAYKRI